MKWGTIGRAMGEAVPDIFRAHAPAWLMGLGVAGFGTTVVLACKATPEALERRRMREVEHDEEALERIVNDIKAMAPCYIPAVIAGAGTLACFIGANRIQSKRILLLTTAYAGAEKALLNAEDYISEKLGDEARKELMENVVPEGFERSEVPFDGGYSYKTDDNGLVNCYDSVTDQFFKTTIENIRTAERNIANRLPDELYVSVSELYIEMGVDLHSHIWDGVGWDVTRVRPEIYFTSMLDRNQKPVLVLNYKTCLIHPYVFNC